MTPAVTPMAIGTVFELSSSSTSSAIASSEDDAVGGCCAGGSVGDAVVGAVGLGGNVGDAVVGLDPIVGDRVVGRGVTVVDVVGRGVGGVVGAALGAWVVPVRQSSMSVKNPNRLSTLRS